MTTDPTPGPLDGDDDLMAELADALHTAHHPQYDLIVSNAQDAYCGTPLEDELARLVFDSWKAEHAGAIRSGDVRPPVRTLAFECCALSVEIEVYGGELIGQVGPPGPALVSMQPSAGEMVTVETDELGCFVLPRPPDGPLRFKVTHAGGRVVTEWTRLHFPE
ncbi:hypothetical protein [Microlunatus ginsengisoli]|uniref:Carboxypeptidase regulatory-like domain-containing protein n=1 Tax=Microlunatus ginsengisoli TaxID=363863 RepID=A0ABP6ZXW1_9ACTN